MHTFRSRAPLFWVAAFAALGSLTCSGNESPFDILLLKEVKASGDAQTGLAGWALNFPPTVQVMDAAGNPAANVVVQFTVTGGGGSVTGATATTNGNGIASVGGWTVQLGANSLSAAIVGHGSRGPVSFTATGAPPLYTVAVRFLGTVSAPRQAVFGAAATRWEQVIWGDIPHIPVNIPGDTLAKYCTGTKPGVTPSLNETINGVVIFAAVDSIDGPGKILAFAGPCFIRLSDKLPVIGAMVFDSADVPALETSGQFPLVIEHEMAHVLGFGTIWGSSYLNLIVGPTTLGGTDPHFTGSQALGAFDRNGGRGYTGGAKVPVENCCTPGGGTNDSHWRESVFTNELMTGFINAGANPLSVVTVAQFGDEGYQVNYAAADPFTLPFGAIRAQGGGGGLFALGDDLLHAPIGVVDDRGRLVRMLAPQ
jgi:leishmanolysin